MANSETATSAEAWQRHLQRWREGGQSVPDYCREHGLDVGAMRYQIRRAPAPAPATTAIRLARVVRAAVPVEATAPAIVVEIGDARVRVERGVDAATLTTVFVALGVRR